VAAEGGSGFGLAGGEAEGVASVEAEEEIDPAVAESAFAVEDYDCVGRGGVHEFIVSKAWLVRAGGSGCLTILGVPAEIGHSEDCVPLPYGRGSECWY